MRTHYKNQLKKAQLIISIQSIKTVKKQTGRGSVLIHPLHKKDTNYGSESTRSNLTAGSNPNN